MEEKDLEQVVIQGLEYESIEKDKAAERKALTRKYGLKLEDAKYSQETQGQTRDIVAERLGISGRHWDRMKYIYVNKDHCTEREYDDWKSGKVSTSKLFSKIKSKQDVCSQLDKIIEKLLRLSFNTPRNTAYIYDKLKYDLFNQKHLKKRVFSSLNDIKDIYDEYADSNDALLTDIIGDVEELKRTLQKKKQ